MALTHHTGIPRLQWQGGYPPCMPSVTIQADINPFCAGDMVTFTPTFNCIESSEIASYAWIVNKVVVSTSSEPLQINTLSNNARIGFMFITNTGQSYFSNVITMQEKTDCAEDALELTFDDIANVPVADASSVSDWNTFFDLPTYGSPFTSVEVESDIFVPKYGLLYNWYAAVDERLICADGWEVPTQAKFDTLVAYLGGHSVAGGKLKEIGLTTWWTPNTGATNDANFNAKGTGYRNMTGTFVQEGRDTSFWSSTAISGSAAQDLTLFHNSSNASYAYLNYFPHGLFIRPVKSATTLTHGQSGTYTGNDGKVYRTICIGTQEWLADNLCETLFRDLTPIPIVEDNAEWAALETGALCAYDNDWDNAYATHCKVKLYGGSGITIKENLFAGDYSGYPLVPNTSLINIADQSSCIIEVGDNSFNLCTLIPSFNFHNLISTGVNSFLKCGAESFIFPNLQTIGNGTFRGCLNVLNFSFPNLTEAGEYAFQGCENVTEYDLPELLIAGINCFYQNKTILEYRLPKLHTAGMQCFRENIILETIDLPNLENAGQACFIFCPCTEYVLSSCLYLGNTVGDNQVFGANVSKTITLTIPAALMTCNAGNPDGDIQYLAANNTLTIIQV